MAEEEGEGVGDPAVEVARKAAHEGSDVLGDAIRHPYDRSRGAGVETRRRRGGKGKRKQRVSRAWRYGLVRGR